MSLTGLIRRSALSLYSGSVASFVRAIGVERYLRRAYQAIYRLSLQLDYLRSTNPQEVEIAGATASFDVSTLTEFWRVTTLTGEEDVIEMLLSELEPDDVFWDIGANIGTHTCLIASILTDGETVAFEPFPHNADRLQRNVEKNDLNNVTQRSTALGATDGTVELSAETDSAGIGTPSISSEPGELSVEVPVVRGDTVRKDLPDPSVIKIDVEGAEADVVDGLATILKANETRFVFCELHPQHGIDPDQMRERFESFGFNVELLNIDGPKPALKASR